MKIYYTNILLAKPDPSPSSWESEILEAGREAIWKGAREYIIWTRQTDQTRGLKIKAHNGFLAAKKQL